MWLLNWLNDRWDKVTEWFGWHYTIWTSRLRNFWTYIDNAIKDAVKWAKDDLLPAISKALTTAKNYTIAKYYEARAYVRSKFSDLQQWATTTFGPLWEKIENGVAYAVQKARDLYYKAHLEVLQAKANIKAWARDFVNANLNPFTWITRYKNFIGDLSKLFGPENREKIATLLSDGFNTLVNFWSNPFGFIISIIEPVFVDLLSWTLAYALGTEEAELPPPPSWSNLPWGYGGPAPSVPKDVAMGLKAPLDSLYISGYRFRPGHEALDLGLERGAPVYTMHDGVIEYINEAYTGYGFQVVVRGTLFWTRYAHLDWIGVRKGQEVEAGEMIGRGNSTGNSTGDHLHLEIKYRGDFVDPAEVLGLS